jgi:hypothetical protein
VPPLSEVLLVALVKVIWQVVRLEVDVAFGIVELFKDVAVEDWG